MIAKLLIGRALAMREEFRVSASGRAAAIYLAALSLVCAVGLVVLLLDRDSIEHSDRFNYWLGVTAIALAALAFGYTSAASRRVVFSVDQKVIVFRSPF